MKRDNPYILPEIVRPIKYRIEMSPDLNKLRYSGNENIEIEVIKDTKHIVLNAYEINIDDARIDNLKAEKIEYNSKYQTARLIFGMIIKKGKHNLKIKFSGRLRSDMRGFYKSEYTLPNGEKKIMASTQFEANDARAAFPCFDEPALKAVFELVFNIEKNLTVISNMPVRKEKIYSGIKTIQFEKTPICSTYLIAFVIGNFEHLQGKAKDGTIVRVFTTPGRKEQGRFALYTGIKCLDFYNKYFGIHYPLPKLDMIAIPDFESGAMENWGAITYRETALLIDEENSSVATKQRVGLVIAHEIAHQWFGNLVTMKWWNDLWLNEGFASWIEYKCLDSIYPEWDLWTQFFHDEIDRAFSLDGLNTSHKIEADVVDPHEIGEIFDAISYSKGASIIRMLEQYIGEDVFRAGLRSYIKRFKYGNTTTEDLWAAMEKASGKKIKELMNNWTKQAGYPIISVSSNKKLSLEQQRFLYIGKKDKSIWKIPISISEGNKARYFEMNARNLEIEMPKRGFQINHSQTGFYRVRYDDRLFENILKDIKQNKLSVLDKVGLQSNAYALARGCYIPAVRFLSLTKAFRGEDDFTLWNDLTANIYQVESLFDEKSTLEAFSNYIIWLYEKIYGKVMWEEKKKEKHTTTLLRSNIIGRLGLSNSQDILNEASRKFNDYLKSKKLDANLKSVVYALAAYNGDWKVYRKIKSLYMEAEMEEEKSRLLSAMAAFKQRGILKDVLEFSLSKDVRAHNAIIPVAKMAINRYAGDITWEFFKDNWNELKRRYSGSKHMMIYFIKFTTTRFSTMEKAEEVRGFFKKNPVPNAKMAVKQSLETIKINHNFLSKNKKEIEGWLRKNY